MIPEPAVPELSRRKVLTIEVGAILAWILLPSLLYPAVYRQDVPPIDPRFPVWNVHHAAASLANLLPFLFVLWNSGDGWKSFGFDRWRWRQDLAWMTRALVAGGVIYSVVDLIPGAFNTIDLTAPRGVPIALSIAFLALIGAFSEEVIFRGYLLTRFEELFGIRKAAILGSALVFGFGHLYQGVGGLIAAALFGVLYGFVFSKRRSIWPLVFAHAINNVVITYVIYR